MPSPVGHSLLGVACAALWSRGRGSLSFGWGVFLFVFVACLPDVDLVFGLLAGALNRFHRMATHSYLFGFCSAGLAWLLWRSRDARVGLAEALFLLLAAGSHLLADWLSIDPSPPHGVMLNWPFSEDYFMSPFAIFPPLSKDSVVDIFQWKNVYPVLLEVLYLSPLFLISVYWTLSGRQRAPRGQ